MAKKVVGYIKLQVPAAKANPSPPVGPALGQHGVNIMQFVKEFNSRTAEQAGLVIPVVITVYADRSNSARRGAVVESGRLGEGLRRAQQAQGGQSHD